MLDNEKVEGCVGGCSPGFGVNHVEFGYYLCSFGILLLFLHIIVYSYIVLDLSNPNKKVIIKDDDDDDSEKNESNEVIHI